MDELDEKPTSVRLNKHHRRILEELRRREDEIPSPSGMIRLLIERADPDYVCDTAPEVIRAAKQGSIDDQLRVIASLIGKPELLRDQRFQRYVRDTLSKAADKKPEHQT